jgi:hypothetical protein
MQLETRICFTETDPPFLSPFQRIRRIFRRRILPPQPESDDVSDWSSGANVIKQYRGKLPW